MGGYQIIYVFLFLILASFPIKVGPKKKPKLICCFYAFRREGFGLFSTVQTYNFSGFYVILFLLTSGFYVIST